MAAAWPAMAWAASLVGHVGGDGVGLAAPGPDLGRHLGQRGRPRAPPAPPGRRPRPGPAPAPAPAPGCPPSPAQRCSRASCSCSSCPPTWPRPSIRSSGLPIHWQDVILLAMGASSADHAAAANLGRNIAQPAAGARPEPAADRPPGRDPARHLGQPRVGRGQPHPGRAGGGGQGAAGAPRGADRAAPPHRAPLPGRRAARAPAGHRHRAQAAARDHRRPGDRADGAAARRRHARHPPHPRHARVPHLRERGRSSCRPPASAGSSRPATSWSSAATSATATATWAPAPPSPTAWWPSLPSPSDRSARIRTSNRGAARGGRTWSVK